MANQNSDPNRDAAEWALGASILLAILLWILLTMFGAPLLMDIFRPRDFGALFVYICFGVSAAGCHLVGVATPLFSGISYLQRILAGLGVSYLFLFANVAGNWIAWEKHGASELEATPFLVPLGCLVVQYPFWFLRVRGKWRIEQTERDCPPLTIRDLLATTALVAVVIATTKSGLSVADAEIAGVAIPAAICLGIVSLVSFISAATYVWFGLKGKTATGLIGVSVYVPVLTCFIVAIVLAIFRGRIWDNLGVCVSIGAFCLTLSAAIQGVRLLGFRLYTGRPDRAGDSPISGEEV